MHPITDFPTAVESTDGQQEKNAKPEGPSMKDNDSRRLRQVEDALIQIKNSLLKASSDIERLNEEKKETEKELAKFKADAEVSKTAKQYFLAHLSHELRTPLTAILGMAEMIDRKVFGPVGDPHYEGYVADIIESARLLLGKFEELLVATRIQQGSLGQNPETLALTEIVETAINQLSDVARQKEIEVFLETVGEAPFIRANRLELEAALMNVLENAIKFSNSGQEILVCVDSEAVDKVFVRIFDSGIGINSDKLDQVTDMFGVQDPWHARNGRGLRLGLYECKALIERAAGGLEINSVLGQGTTVTICLPKIPSAPVLNFDPVDR